MRHTVFIIATLAALLAPTASARAGMVDDCMQAHDLDTKVSGCTVVIRSGQWQGKELAWAYNNRSLAYFYLGNPARAIEDYDQALRLDPGLAVAYLGRGVVYDALGLYHRAIEDFDQALRLDPSMARAYNDRGFSYGKLGEYRRAIKDFDQALRLDPGDAEAYTNRGISYNGLGEYGRAIEDFDQALRLGTGSALAYNNRGFAYSNLGKYRHAIRDYGQVLRLDPDSTLAYNNLGSAYNELGEYRRAIENFAQALRLDPGLTLAYLGRGFAYAELDEYRRAIKDYDEALQLDPENAPAYNNRGISYNGLGEYGRAIEDFDQALRLDPGLALAYNNRAFALDRLNKSGETYRRPGSPSTPQVSNSELEVAKAQERRWGESTRRGVQNALMWTGDYNARLDGDFGPITRKAIRSFQSRNGYAPTGYLTAPQIENLESQRLAAIDYVDFRIIDEMETGIRVGIPEKIFRRGVRDGVSLKFESAAGFPLSNLYLVSFPGGRDELSAMYNNALSILNDGKSAYQVFRGDWFVVSHEENGTRFYSYGVSDGWAVKGFMLFWSSSESMLFESISAAMFNSFEPLMGIVLDSGMPATGSEVFAEQGSVDRDAGTAQQEAMITSTGTGFFVDAAGRLLTNAHVVEGCAALTVGDGRPAELLAQDGNADLALLRAPVSAANGVARFSARPARLNADVTVVGFPLHGVLGGLNVTRGSVSSTSGLGGDDDYFQMSAAVQPGNSGGPVVNEFGAVVGVVQSKLDAISVAAATGDIPQNINFAIRAELAKLFLNKHGVDFEIETNQVRVEPWALADDAKRYTVLISCWNG